MQQPIFLMSNAANEPLQPIRANDEQNAGLLLSTLGYDSPAFFRVYYTNNTGAIDMMQMQVN